MDDLLPGYTGQATRMNPRPAPMTPEQKLASMAELLPTDLLAMLARLMQGGPGAAPQAQPAPQAGIPGVSGAFPTMGPAPQAPIIQPRFAGVRG